MMCNRIGNYDERLLSDHHQKTLKMLAGETQNKLSQITTISGYKLTKSHTDCPSLPCLFAVTSMNPRANSNRHDSLIGEHTQLRICAAPDYGDSLYVSACREIEQAHRAWITVRNLLKKRLAEGPE